MKWTTLNFGKHAGFSLPQIILSDADWFFWAFYKDFLWGRLADEADDLAAKAVAIKIPKPDAEHWEVEYRYEEDGRFCEFEFVRKDAPSYGAGYRRVSRLPYLDLSFIRRSRTYDKCGCRNLLRDFRRLYFGHRTRLSKRRCERFFSNRKNFLG